MFSTFVCPLIFSKSSAAALRHVAAIKLVSSISISILPIHVDRSEFISVTLISAWKRYGASKIVCLKKWLNNCQSHLLVRNELGMKIFTWVKKRSITKERENVNKRRRTVETQETIELFNYSVNWKWYIRFRTMKQ